MRSARQTVLVILLWEAGPIAESAICEPVAAAVFEELEAEGLIERKEGGWVITASGRDYLTSGDWIH